jgi:hypothetical protein
LQSESELSSNNCLQKNEDLICEFEKIFRDFKSQGLKFVMFLGLLTFDVEKADEEVQMELIDTQCNSIFKRKSVILVYQIFTLSSPGIGSQKFQNLSTKYVQCLAAHNVCEQLHERLQLTDTHLS